jgi:phosphopantetheinyl transferase
VIKNKKRAHRPLLNRSLLTFVIGRLLRLFFYVGKFSQNKKGLSAFVRQFFNQTHGGTYLVLLPSGSDTLHKPTIVLAFRQDSVYLILMCLTSLSFDFLKFSFYLLAS